jgi:hypothetical protein
MIRRCLTTTMTKTMSLRARVVAAEEVEEVEDAEEEEAVEEAVVEGAGARVAKSVSSSKEDFSV